MSGYTPDEKLRVEQLTKLRRQWLKDQELSPREPVLPAKPLGPIAKFWAGFLEPKSLWRLYVSRRSFHINTGVDTFWAVHYFVKYHVSGDTILETGEVVPELPESHGHH
uniref:NADH dehydrogenase [ubiquinone] 1 beta subcomplex subunit 6 n=1 Tax=Labrus bergylta TaxID=56723 RepID=A0A3Q3GA81_9LABR